MAPAREPIAIVGASCRLAGQAASLPGLWEMMCKSRTALGRVPPARWDADAWYHPDPDRKGSLTSKHAFFLDQDVAAFDAPFFAVTAKEAAGMEPAKRLLLEVAYEAFENAGMAMEDVAGSMTGVYVGSMTSDYEALATREVLDQPHMAPAGTSEAMTANRVSWFYDLLGPSLTVDTACSSSLYALHLACQSLLLGETDMGLVGGVNVILDPNFMGQLVAMHMLSPDGISHSFDHRANGYGRGEGIGALIVKRLSDAVRDGDTIRAVIRGSSINVDGKTPSVTMPSSGAHAALIRRAYKDANLSLADTQYVEMHGTGTPVGDPIELAGIAATFGAAATPEKPILVGSIKPTVGHTEGCAGLAGVFKAILALEHGILVPTAEIEAVHPKLRFAENNLKLVPNTMVWPSDGLRRVSVNSFGFGGANAHVILDDAYHYMKEFGLDGKHATSIQPRLDNISAIAAATNGDSNGHINGHTNGHRHTNIEVSPIKKLFTLSARDEKALQRLAKSLADYWKSGCIGLGYTGEEDRYVSDVAYTLGARRSKFDYRSFVVASTTKELVEQLEQQFPKMKRAPKQQGLAFVFTGQGAQWAGMGRELIEFPVFAASIARSKAILDELGCPFDLETELADVTSSKIEKALYSQPICSAVQIALTDLMADWGVMPKAVVGHSSGEIASAYAAGIITHKDAIKVAYFRGIYSEKAANGAKNGAMLAAGISEEDANDYLKEHPVDSAVVACINSPKSVTLSGDADVVTALEVSINNDQKFARKLRVATAYHSPHMRVVAQECLAAMTQAGIGEPMSTETLMFSSVTGELIDPAQISPEYWVRNMCSPVRFSQAVHAMLTWSPNKRRLRSTAVQWTSLVELGPHSALKAPLVQIMEGIDKKLPQQLPYTSALVRKENATTTALKAAGHLWALGYPIAIAVINREADGAKAASKPQVVVDLPAYPWNHEKTFWHESAATKDLRLQRQPRTDLLGAPIENQNPFEPEWRNFLGVRESPWVEDHKITGTTLYPGAGMLIMVVEAVKQIAAKDAVTKGVEFRDVTFDRGLVIPSDGAVETRLSIGTPTTGNSAHSFSVYSRLGDAPWARHCWGSFTIFYEDAAADPGSSDETAAAQEWESYVKTYEELKETSGTEEVDIKKLYNSLEGLGMGYGPTFQNLASLVACPEQEACYGTIAVPDTKSVMPFGYEFPHVIHPATLDAIFHLIVVAVGGGPSMTEAAVPYQLEKLYIASDLPHGAGALFSGYSKRTYHKDNKQMKADLIATDTAWSAPKVVLKGLVMRQVTSGGSGGADSDASTAGSILKRTTQLIWKADPAAVLESSAGTQSLQITRLRDWIELECHKSPKLRVLLAASTLPMTVLAELAPFMTQDGNGGLYRGITHCAVVAQSEEDLEMWKTQILTTATATAKPSFEYRTTFPKNAGVAAEDVGQGQAKYDIIIMGGDGKGLVNTEELLGHVLDTMGRLVIWQEATANSPTTPSSLNLPAGFRSVDIPLDAQQSLVIAGLPHTYTETPAAVSLLVPESVRAGTTDTPDNTTATIIRHELERLGVQVELVHLQDLIQARGVVAGEGASSKPVISLLDLYGQATNDWTTEEFSQFQRLVADASHIFWITQCGLADEQDLSEEGLRSSATIPGLFRVLRNEYAQLRLAHLDVSPSFEFSGPKGIKLIVDTWLRTFQGSASLLTDQEAAHNEDAVAAAAAVELEFGERGGHVMLPRVVTAPGMDEEVALSEGTAPAISTRLSKHDWLRLMVEGDAAGQDGGLIWTTDGTDKHGADGDDSHAQGSSDQVAIRVSHVCVDRDQLGPEDAAHALLQGIFISGVVTRAGVSSSNRLRIGDRVLSIDTGRSAPLSTVVHRQGSLVVRCPDGLDSATAAAEAWMHMTALYVIRHVSRVEPNEVVLIEDGATGLGQAVVFAARRARARVITTVGSPADKAHLLYRFGGLGLQDESVVVLRGASDLSSLDVVLANKVGAGGLDVVVSSPASGGGAASVVGMLTTSLSDFARVVLVGSPRSGAAPLPIRSNVQVFATDPMQILRHRPALAAQLLAESGGTLSDLAFTGLHLSGSAGPTTMSIADLPAARAWLEKPASSGVLSVELTADAVIPLARAPPPPLQVDSSATYILAGGLGQLGLRIGDLLVAHGAKHLCFLSRSGSRARYGDRLAAIEARGCQVAVFACDIGSADRVKDVVSQITALGHPIKGLVQCAMDLQDSLFSKMSYTQWSASLAPKVSGTWNLHAALPADLDFFVMLSSVVSIIGNIAQSNYAAGNAYMDALARFRRARSMKATSINAGLVRDTDHTVDGTHMTDYLTRFPHIASVTTNLDELMSGIVAAIRGTTADGKIVPPQFVFCMTDTLRPQGVDTWASDAKFVHRVAIAAHDAVDDNTNGPSVADNLRSTTSLEEAALVVQEALKALLAPGLGIQPADISDESPLYDIGVDSFKAVEVRNRVFRDLESEISVFEVLSPSTLAQTSRIIASRSRLVPAEIRTGN